MIPISDDFIAFLQENEQSIRPVVTAVWADSKRLDNLICSSSSDFYMPKTDTFSPTLLWKLNDTTSTIIDSSGNDHTGTATSINTFNDVGIIYDDVSPSYSMQFKGTSKIVIPDTDDLNPNNNFVLEMFCNFKGATAQGVSFPFASGNYVLAAKASGTSSFQRQYEILVHSNGTQCKIQGNVYINGTKYSITDTNVLNITTDYYIALQVYAGNVYLTVNTTLNPPVSIFTNEGNQALPMGIKNAAASTGRLGICAGQAGTNQTLANNIKGLWTAAGNTDIPVVRIDCSWAGNQPSRGGGVATGKNNDVSHFAANIGAILTFHQNAGNQVLLVLGIDTPSWAGTGGHHYPTHNEDWANFCWLMVDYVETNFPGIAFGYELWNEPNNGFGMIENDVTLYTPFFIAGSDGIKNGNVISGNNHTGYPSVKVCTAGLGPAFAGDPGGGDTWCSYMLSNGAAPFMDAFALHLYGLECPPNNNVNWNNRTTTLPNVRTLLDNAGHSSIPVWVTEDGCFTRGDSTPTSSSDGACNTKGSNAGAPSAGGATGDETHEITEKLAGTRIGQWATWYLSNKILYNIGIMFYYEYEDTLDASTGQRSWSNNAGIFQLDAGHNGAVKTEVYNAFVSALTKVKPNAARTAPTSSIYAPVSDPTSATPLSGSVGFLFAGTDTVDASQDMTCEFYRDNGATRMPNIVGATGASNAIYNSFIGGWGYAFDSSTLADGDYKFKVKFTNSAGLSTFSAVNKQRIQNAATIPFPIGFSTGGGLPSTDEMDAYKLSGARFARFGVKWDAVSAGVNDLFDTPNGVIKAVAYANSIGLDVILQIGSGPTYGGKMYDHNVNFAKLIVNIAAVFTGTKRSDGNYVLAIECGNEMNHDLWDDRADNWLSGNPGDKGRAYADLMIRVTDSSFENIRSKNSTTPIIIGGLGGELTKGNDVTAYQFTLDTHTSVTVTAGTTTKTYAHGIRSHFDGWTCHPYCYDSLPGDDPGTRGWSNMITIMNWFLNIEKFLPPLWITEYGQPTVVDLNNPLLNTVDKTYQHAADSLSDPTKGAIPLLISYMTNNNWNVMCFSWFTYQDNNKPNLPPTANDNHFGIVENNADPTPVVRGSSSSGSIEKEHLWQTFHDLAITSAGGDSGTGTSNTKALAGTIPSNKLTGALTTLKITAAQNHSKSLAGTIPSANLGGAVTTLVIPGGGPPGSFAVGGHPSINSVNPPIPIANIQYVAFYKGVPFYPIVSSARYLSGLNAGPMQYTKNYYTAEEAANGLEQESYLFAALDAVDPNGDVITANGQFTGAEPDPASKQFEYGWWSRNPSNGSGNFSTVEMLTVEFDTRLANSINVLTSQYFGKVSLYDIYFKDDSETWNLINTNQSFSGGYENIHLINDDGSASAISGVYLILRATENPNDVARIQEIAPVFSEDISNDVVSFTANKVRDNYDSTVPIGITQTNNLGLIVQNVDQKYSKYNSKSLVYGYVEPEIKFIVGLEFNDPAIVPGSGGTTGGTAKYGDNTYGTGEYGDGGTTTNLPTTGGDIQFIPVGTFYSDEAITSTDDMICTFNCRDMTKYFQDNTVDGFLFQGKTVADAMRYLARYGNVYNSQINIQEKYVDKIYKLAPYAYIRFNELLNSIPCAVLGGTGGGTPFLVNAWVHPTNGTMTYNFDFDKGCDNLTLEFWTKIDNTDKQIFNIVGDSGLSVIAAQIVSNQIHINLFNDFTTPHSTNQYFACPQLLDFKWHHVAFTYDKSALGAWVFYVDGVEIAHDKIGTASTLTPDYFTSVGFYGPVSGSPSRYTDIRMWTTTMNNNRILDVMNTRVLGHEQNLYSVWDFSEALSAASGTLGATTSKTNASYWLAGATFSSFKVGIDSVKCFSDDMLSLNTTDTFGTVVKGQEGPMTNFSDPTNFSAFNPSSFGYVQTLGNSSTDNMNKFSFAGLILVDDASTPGHIPVSKAYVFSAEGSATGSCGLYVDPSGFLVFEILGVGILTSSVAMSFNDWHHIAVTHNKLPGASAHLTQLFIDGEKVASSTGLYNIGNLFPSWIQMIGTDKGSFSLQGNVSEFAFFNDILADDEIADLYTASISPEQDVYSYLYSVNQTIWDTMLQIALPDFGMFYIDEFDKFNYESAETLYSSIYGRFTESQYSLTDTNEIQSADEQLELMVNKVQVNIYNAASGTTESEIWRAPDGESLAVTTLAGTITKSTQSIPFTTAPDPSGEANIYVPIFPTMGYFRIDNEIIGYSTNTKGIFNDCQRGLFGTVEAPHTSGAALYEAKIYNIAFSSTPVVSVKYPFISQAQAGLVTIHSWTSTSFGATLLISASDPDISPHYVILEGTNPVTNDTYAFAIAGLTIAQNTASQTLQNALLSAAPQIRRFRLKSVTIDNPFVTTTTQANNIAQHILDHFKNGASILHVTTIGLPQLQLGDRITIEHLDMLSIYGQDFWIIEEDLTYDGGLVQTMTLRETV